MIDLSIVVIFYDMEECYEDTLLTMSREFQVGIEDVSYEVIAIDNNSPVPLDEGAVERFGPEFKLVRYETEGRSPVEAINYGLSICTGEYVAVVVDGARMLSNGVIAKTLSEAKRYPRACVYTQAFNLATYSCAPEEAFNVELKMKKQTGWPGDSKSIISKGILCDSYGPTLQGKIPTEFTWYVVKRSFMDSVGRYNENFKSHGGGLMNQELVIRMVKHNPQFVFVQDEYSIHQYHNRYKPKGTMQVYFDEFEQVTGRAWQQPNIKPTKTLGAKQLFRKGDKRWVHSSYSFDIEDYQ